MDFCTLLMIFGMIQNEIRIRIRWTIHHSPHARIYFVWNFSVSNPELSNIQSTDSDRLKGVGESLPERRIPA